VTYNEIHPVLRAALGAFEMLRRFGFTSDDIFFTRNETAYPPEPARMMFVVLKTQKKEFTIRVGVVDLPQEEWTIAWRAVAEAALERRIEEVDRIVEESEAFQRKAGLVMAIQAKGIRVPAANRHLS
jgi:hypothetical protein